MDIHIQFNDGFSALATLAWVVGSILVGYYGARILSSFSPARSGDERAGYAFGAIIMGILGVIALLVSIVLLWIGGAGWAFLAALALFGAAAGFGSRS